MGRPSPVSSSPTVVSVSWMLTWMGPPVYPAAVRSKTFVVSVVSVKPPRVV